MDLLWISNLGPELSLPVPSWNGFMQIEVQGGEFDQAKIQILPFINMNPNNMSSKYTALCFAKKLCDDHNIAAATVTFDRALYIKAVEIISSYQNELNSLFARLGGFHWLMSAIGSLGYIMGGTGVRFSGQFVHMALYPYYVRTCILRSFSSTSPSIWGMLIYLVM